MTNIEGFCHLIGCSGLSDKCPGNPNCDIVRRIEVDKFAKELEDE